MSMCLHTGELHNVIGFLNLNLFYVYDQNRNDYHQKDFSSGNNNYFFYISFAFAEWFERLLFRYLRADLPKEFVGLYLDAKRALQWQRGSSLELSTPQNSCELQNMSWQVAWGTAANAQAWRKQKNFLSGVLVNEENAGQTVLQTLAEVPS